MKAEVWVEFRVCLRVPGRPESILRASMELEHSRSSLLSDCTNGLVGGLYAKLEERDDEREEIPEPILSTLPSSGLPRSYPNGLKCLGGDVEIQVSSFAR